MASAVSTLASTSSCFFLLYSDVRSAMSFLNLFQFGAVFFFFGSFLILSILFASCFKATIGHSSNCFLQQDRTFLS
ncbi:hypothetical protein HanRHA438_Chr17g0809671 [Helianthus annuus]|nr:hypothetical protein HanRHA438_Chr17g0809671 [Helianthus annuus]